MIVSTKGRYALSVMLDLAQQEQTSDEYVSLKDVARRQGISMKYLESIVAVLNKGGMVVSQRGKSGGYRLAKAPGAYTVGSILTMMEGSIAPVDCVSDENGGCERATSCLTYPMWKRLDELMDEYLDSVTLEDLILRRVK